MFFFSFLPQEIKKGLPFLLFFIILQEAVSPPVKKGPQKKGHEDNKVDEKNDGEHVSSELCNKHSCY
jgi:hypothetical protein